MAAQTQTKQRKSKTNGQAEQASLVDAQENEATSSKKKSSRSQFKKKRAVAEPDESRQDADETLEASETEEESEMTPMPVLLTPDLDDPDDVTQQLRQVMRQTSEELEQLLLQMDETNLLPDLDTESMLDSLRQVEVFLHKPSFVIGFAGGFNAGKSMLINALLGEQLLRDGAVPTTSTVTRVVACAPGQEEMRIHFFSPEQFESLFDQYYEDFTWLYNSSTDGPPPHGRDALTELLDDIKFLREQLEAAEWNDRIRSLDSFYDLIVAFINHHHLLQQGVVVEPLTRKTLTTYTTKSENSVAPLVREVQLSMHHPMLAEGSQLIDLPGLGSPDPRDEEITVAALRGDAQSGRRECDAVVHVMDSLSPFRAGEDRLFQIYRKVWGETFARRVFLVVSRWGKLERYNADEMLAVGQTIQKVAERFHIDPRKLFIVDGRIGAITPPMREEERSEAIAQQREDLQHLRQELEACILPSGENLFAITARVMADGNVPNLRDAMQYYLATYKELLHLNDALRLLDNLISKLNQTVSLELPPLDQLEDDEDQFMEQCRSDFERHLRLLRQKIRGELPLFLQGLLQNTILPDDLSGLCNSLYQTLSQQLETHDPEQLRQQLLTHQLMQDGPLTSPIPWEGFRFLFQKAVQRLEQELEQFCGAISHQAVESYRRFLFEELGLMEVVERAFGTASEGRKIVLAFQELLQQLERDLQLVARNLNRVFFYEYSDIYHRRDTNDARVEIRQELEEYLGHDASNQPTSASRATRWLLRHKMEHHFTKLGTFLPLCFLQQLQETHRQLNDLLEETGFSIRQAYNERLERREIGQEVDRIRHQYRQTRACVEKLNHLRTLTSHARTLLQAPALQR